MVGNIVQIGIEWSPEYLLLSEAGTLWRDVVFRNDYRGMPCFDVFSDVEEWSYYGVDSDVNSISFLSKKYGNKGSWILAFVSGDESVSLVPCYSSFFDNSVFKGVYIPSLSLGSLFDGLELDSVEVLVVDIEGAENVLFANYSFALKPRFILVDCHGGSGYELSGGILVENVVLSVQDRLLGYGYELIKRVDVTDDTVVCYFILR